MKIIFAIAFAVLSILTIEIPQYQAGFLARSFNHTRYNNTRFNTTGFLQRKFNYTRFNNTRFNPTRFSFTKFINKPSFLSGFNTRKFSPGKANLTTFGQVRQYDKLIYKEEVYVPAKILQKVKKSVTLPNALKFHFKQISAINVTDLLRNGKNGASSLVKGGVGQNNATIEFKSKRGWPMKFLVEFFGA